MGLNRPIRPLDDDRRALASNPRHVAFARKVAAAFARRYPPLVDEIESAAMLGLVQAAASFDPGRGLKFTTHAADRIKGAILDACRDSGPKGFRRDRRGAPTVKSLDAATSRTEDGSETSMAYMVAVDEGPVGWEEEYQDELRGLARRAGDDVVRLFYGRADCSTMKAAGAELGFCESRISQRHGTAIVALRGHFGDSSPGEVVMAGIREDTPSPEELAEIKARLRELRAAKEAEAPPTPQLRRKGYCEPRSPRPATLPEVIPAATTAAEGARKAVQLYRRLTGAAGPQDQEAETVTQADTNTNGVHHADPKATCKRCGKSYPGRGRCFGCSPITEKDRESQREAAKARFAAKATAPAPAVVEKTPPIYEPAPGPAIMSAPVMRPVAAAAPPPPTSPLLAELDAARRVAEALATLDGRAARRVLAWVGGHYPGEG